MIHQPIATQGRSDPAVIIEQIDTGPHRQVGPQFPTRCVESRTGELRCPVSSSHFESPLMPEHEVKQATVGDLYPFGSTCRARGIDDIDQVVGSDGRDGVGWTLLRQHFCIGIQADNPGLLGR